ncbi:sulfite exporter TauE/SafE family protein [Chloroflexota bacterium]
MELTLALFIAVLFISLFCQYFSTSIGIGYGTILTPLLLILGFLPLQVVPAVLASQFVGGAISGLAHHQAGNITLDFKRDDRVKKRLRGLGYMPRSIDSKVIFVLASCGIIGVLIGVFVAVNIPQLALETYIGIMVLGIGLAIILRRSHNSTITWKGLITLGLLSAFNKGVSGGGYVPLVTGGQIIFGREPKSSVGSTTVSVSIVCAVGFLSYLLIKGNIYWLLVAATTIGSVVAAPLAAFTVKKVDPGKLTLTIGVATVILGTLTLVKIFVL